MSKLTRCPVSEQPIRVGSKKKIWLQVWDEG